MNLLNHFLFSITICLLFIPFDFFNILLALLFSFSFNLLIDLDNKLNKKAPWYTKRTWIQETLAIFLIALPLAILFSIINKLFFLLLLIPYTTHIFLDYLCVFEAKPLAPFSKIKKKEGLGIFIPDELFRKSENSRKWTKRVKVKKIKGISENYFTIISILLLFSSILIRFLG